MEHNHTPPSSRSRRRNLFIILGFVVSIFFMYLTFRKIDYYKVIGEIVRIDLGWMLLGLLVQFVGLLFMAVRSRFLLQPLYPFPFYRLLKSVFVAFAGNNVLPMRAGEFLRIDYLARHGQIPHSSTLAVVILERLLDLLWLILLFFVLLPLVMTQRPSGQSLYFLAAMVILLLGLVLVMNRYPQYTLNCFSRFTPLFGQRISCFLLEKLQLFLNGLNAVKSPWRVFGVLVATGCYWVCGMLNIQCWLWAFGISLPWYAPIFILVMLAFGVTLPSAPGFIGTYHYFVKSAILLLGANYLQADTFFLVGVSSHQADAFALVCHAAVVVPFTIIGIILLLPDYLRKRTQ
jgi:hypothetical protein